MSRLGIGSRVERADGRRGEVVALTLLDDRPVVKVQWDDGGNSGWKWASQYRPQEDGPEVGR